MGSSNVITCRCCRYFNRVYKVVDFPDPVVPVIKMSPLAWVIMVCMAIDFFFEKPSSSRVLYEVFGLNILKLTISPW